MNFGGIQWTTTLDYPGEIATILFTQGCNMRCGFCHNSSIVSGDSTKYRDEDVIEKLLKRKHLIDHIVITGGEPSLHDMEMIEFMEKLKKEGFKIKLDTNGLNPDFLFNVIYLNLVDYIAMDIKTIFLTDKYSEITGINITEEKIDDLKHSVRTILHARHCKSEFRTTVIKTYHTKEILNKIASLGLPNHYFQQFVKSDKIFDSSLSKYSDTELELIVTKIQERYPNIFLRGI